MLYILVIFAFMASWLQAKRILRSSWQNLVVVNNLSFRHCSAKRLICSRCSLTALKGIKRSCENPKWRS